MATCGEHGGRRADGTPCGNKVTDLPGDLCYLHEDRVPSLPPPPLDVPAGVEEQNDALERVALRQALGLPAEGDGRLAHSILVARGHFPQPAVRVVDETPTPAPLTATRAR